ncbi:hypothetical protein [Lentilactobacillus sp. SPB1-3]|uniref:Uncharacterized protein n=1 Tax=Lentilactobacillus terminaliae TaxID=3003483 RepID=A0ACD5DF81_9LACO|nr:hypothetical protein [Lentilactobacillus sp. SPB1-3]MCZ0976331.1 hypothetical protein [Lentilactobacillus sp. SPB1-3]
MGQLITYGLLVVGVIYMCSKSFKYENISRFGWITIPVYCLIMFVINVNLNEMNLIKSGIIVVIGFLIAYFQQLQAKIKFTDEVDKHDRPVIKIQRNWTYVIGWFLVFAASITLQILWSKEMTTQEVITQLSDEIQKDLLVWRSFAYKSSWYIWLLSGINMISYTLLIMRRDKRIQDAIRRR